jgi:hypothetical protein
MVRLIEPHHSSLQISDRRHGPRCPAYVTETHQARRAEADPFRPTAGSCRYNALRSPTAGVGQGGSSTFERAVLSATERGRTGYATDRPSGQTT